MTKLPVPMPPPGEMLRRKQRDRTIQRKRLMRIQWLCLLAVTAWILFSQVFLLCRNRELGMFPTAEYGDLVLAHRLCRDYGKEDMVLYRVEGKVRLGRIAAVETDVVAMGRSGSLLVNGSVQRGRILYPTYARDNRTYAQKVPEGMVFILGDHRTQSYDSRDHGCVRVEDILGKVIAIVRMGDP